jgi:hypothetical protein
MCRGVQYLAGRDLEIWGRLARGGSGAAVFALGGCGEMMIFALIKSYMSTVSNPQCLRRETLYVLLTYQGPASHVPPSPSASFW